MFYCIYAGRFILSTKHRYTSTDPKIRLGQKETRPETHIIKLNRPRSMPDPKEEEAGINNTLPVTALLLPRSQSPDTRRER
jgi:hypothetical protein